MFPFKKSKKNGDDDKKTRLNDGLNKLKAGDIKLGMVILYRLGMEDYPEAEYWLGDINEFNLNNFAEAAKWYAFAAEHGNPQAMFCIANMLMTGKGVKEDHREAVKWYKKAAVNGIPDAQFMMGELTRTGNTIQQNHTDAHKWYELALQNGCSHAQMRLEQMAANIGT